MVGKINLNKKEVLQVCQKVEKTMANIYAALSKAHQEDPELASLWKKTAQEEENHARQFDSALRFIDDLAEDIKIPKEDAITALDRASAMLEKIQTTGLSPVDSLTMAISLERDFSEVHMHLAVTFKKESDQKLFKAMMSADKDHVNALVQALDKRARA